MVAGADASGPAGTPAPVVHGTGTGAVTPVPAVPTPVPTSHSGAIPTGPADLVGSILADRYRILRKLGEGGMGSVYLAEHTTINKRLAIKVLSPEYCHKQDLVNRFLQEARAASMIEQENVVEITDFGSTPGGSVFFAMEYLNGEDLAATIKREGALAWPRVRHVLLQICSALGAAHAAGIIHRDMKPENCYRIRRGSNEDFVKVLDFGIAKVQSDEGDTGRALTRTGMIFGTPEYMSPEQAKGEKVDHRVDVYAVGVIMYELLTGRVPFTADTFMGILTKHMFEAPQAPSAILGPGLIPPDAEAIILKALQKDREYRFQTMAEMARAIEAVGTGAAPVSVVREQVVAPRGGQLRFSGNSTAIEIGADDVPLAPPRSRAPLFLAVGAAAALVAAGGWLAVTQLDLLGSETTPATTAEVAAQGPATEVVKPDPTPPPVAPPQPTPVTVKITISTPGIDAEVLSDSDDGVLGRTNKPIDLPRGTEQIGLRLRAQGYQETLVNVTPDATKTIQSAMSAEAAVTPPPVDTKKAPKDKDKKKPKKGHETKADGGADPDAKAEPKTEPKPDTKTEPKPDAKTDPTKPPKPTNSSPDLKDPFNKGK
jgi:serine/threonine-protein kinase